ncbi:MAG TPA: heavy metal-responsive transcriptional regulator [Acidimicrobiia bacterium]|jgi:DNA-binding transcriptional MerR regulator|nr:heavy metal-responsive transcriptional regulator [Acidimicrobiia bacterium]
MRIGELARRTLVPTKTIRYYEEIGVLSAPDRAANDYRDYPDEAVDRLAFVRDAQATGLTLTEIASILDLRSHGEATCHHVIDLLERHLTALDRHIKTLRQTRRKLATLTERARSLDPSDCHDPNRCQTIAGSGRLELRARDVGRHLHTAPAGHSH